MTAIHRTFFATLVALLLCVAALAWAVIRQGVRVDSAYGAMTMLREDMEDLQVRVNALEDRDGSIGDVYANMTELREDLSSLDGRVYALEHRDGGRP